MNKPVDPFVAQVALEHGEDLVRFLSKRVRTAADARDLAQEAYVRVRHESLRVEQRMHSNQLLVDWFRFWLKDEERRTPNRNQQESAESLAQQYERWRQMKIQQNTVMESQS